MTSTYVSKTSLEQRTNADGTTSHRHCCVACLTEWWDLASYGKWCSDSCYRDENGPDDFDGDY